MVTGDIIIIVMLSVVFAAAIRSAIKRRKKGGCGCEGCTHKCGKDRTEQ